jgi:hypothetical protein
MPPGVVPTNEGYSAPAEGVAVQLEGQTAGYYGDSAGAAEPQIEAAPLDDDDAVIVPPPPIEYLAHAHPSAHAEAPFFKRTEYKRTIIPLLLTMSVCMAVLAIGKYICREDTVIGALKPAIQYSLFVLAAISLVSGVLLMLQVRSELMRQGPAPAGRKR